VNCEELTADVETTDVLLQPKWMAELTEGTTLSGHDYPPLLGPRTLEGTCIVYEVRGLPSAEGRKAPSPCIFLAPPVGDARERPKPAVAATFSIVSEAVLLGVFPGPSVTVHVADHRGRVSPGTCPRTVPKCPLTGRGSGETSEDSRPRAEFGDTQDGGSRLPVGGTSAHRWPAGCELGREMRAAQAPRLPRSSPKSFIFRAQAPRPPRGSSPLPHPLRVHPLRVT